jgi:hypothetical protein
MENKDNKEMEEIERLVRQYKKFATEEVEKRWHESINDAKVTISMNPRLSSLIGLGCSSCEMECRGLKLRIKVVRVTEDGKEKIHFDLYTARPWIGLMGTFKLRLLGRDKDLETESEFYKWITDRVSVHGYVSTLVSLDWADFVENYAVDGRFRLSITFSITKIFHTDDTFWDVESENKRLFASLAYKSI